MSVAEAIGMAGGTGHVIADVVGGEGNAHDVGDFGTEVRIVPPSVRGVS